MRARTLTSTCPHCGRDTTATLIRRWSDDSWHVLIIEQQCRHFAGVCDDLGISLGFLPLEPEWVQGFEQEVK